MDMYTLAGASENLGCTINRLKDWMNKGLIPDNRIIMGKHKARILDEITVNKIKRVLEGIDSEGLSVRASFARYYN